MISFSFCCTVIFVVGGELPTEIGEAAEMYAGCIAGAIQRQVYLELIEANGLNYLQIKRMKRYMAELLGTFALVLCGTGAIVINQQSGGMITHVGIAITFGLIVMAMIYTFGNISGAHLNPAVSIGFTIAGRLPAKDLLLYVLSQVAGAFLASLLLKYLFPTNEFLGTTLPAGTPMQSFILELLLSFFLMLVIINVATGSKEQGMFAGLAIGSTVLLEAMFAGPVCGASMNPARSLAPAIVSTHTEHLWIYLTAPVIGAVAAIPIWKYLSSVSSK